MFLFLSAAQQTEEGAEGTSSTEVASTTAAASAAAAGAATTPQGRAITTVTQSTPAPGPSVPVRNALVLPRLRMSECDGFMWVKRHFLCLSPVDLIHHRGRRCRLHRGAHADRRDGISRSCSCRGGSHRHGDTSRGERSVMSHRVGLHNITFFYHHHNINLRNKRIAKDCKTTLG